MIMTQGVPSEEKRPASSKQSGLNNEYVKRVQMKEEDKIPKSLKKRHSGTICVHVSVNISH